MIQASACRVQVDIYVTALALLITVLSCVVLDSSAHTAPLERIPARCERCCCDGFALIVPNSNHWRVEHIQVLQMVKQITSFG